MKRLRSLLPLLILVAVGVGLFLSGSLDRFSPEKMATEQVQLQQQIADHPVLAPLIQIGAMWMAVSTGIPGAVVIVFAGGMLFGVVFGTVLSTIGLTLGALTLFFASRHAFGDHTHGGAPALVERLRGGYQAHPVSYTFFLRLVPVFPFGGVTVALAWLRCPTWLFVVSAVGGGAVMTGFETALGAGLARNIAETGHLDAALLHDPRVFAPMLGLAVLALVPIAIQRWRARRTPKPSVAP